MCLICFKFKYVLCNVYPADNHIYFDNKFLKITYVRFKKIEHLKDKSKTNLNLTI